MRKILLILLTFFCIITSSLGLIACSSDSNSVVDPNTGAEIKIEFEEGHLVEYNLGESIMVKEYLSDEIRNYKTDDGKKGYKLEIIFGDKVYDLTNKATFEPDEIGEWKLVLTVDGTTIETTITVKGRPLSWIYSKPTIEFEIGGENGTIDFEQTLDAMEIEVYSDAPYKTYISSVLIGSATAQRIDLSEKTSYTFTSNDVHIFDFTTVAEDGQEVLDTFFALPKTDETKVYINVKAPAIERVNYPFTMHYAGGNVGSAILKPDIATDGYYVDELMYARIADYDWAGLRASREYFVNNYFGWNDAEKFYSVSFDVYNSDSSDHTYTVFHHLKDEYLPEGSKGTLKAGEWTTVTITREMFEKVFNYNNLANTGNYAEEIQKYYRYDTIQFGIYYMYRDSWVPTTQGGYPFTFAAHNSNYTSGGSDKISFYIDNVKMNYPPESDETMTFVGSTAEYPFYSYKGSATASSIYKPNLATDGFYVDELKYTKIVDYDWAGLRAYSAYFVEHYFGWNDKEKLSSVTFDVYNSDTVDHTYTLFHHLKDEYLPEGSKGTLRAGQWTTIKITRAMFEEVYALVNNSSTWLANISECYEADRINDGIYYAYKDSWVSKGGIAFSFAAHNSNYTTGGSDNISFYVDNLRINTPKSNGAEQYTVLSGSNRNKYPINMGYAGEASIVAGQVVHDDYLMDKLTYTYNTNSDCFVLLGNQGYFGPYYYATLWQNGNPQLDSLSFDVYNPNDVDLPYTLFPDLKSDKRPAGSTGTLEAKKWTTITITKAMFDTAFGRVQEDYTTINNCVYGAYKPGWHTGSSATYMFGLEVKIANHSSLTTGDTVSVYLDNMKMVDTNDNPIDCVPIAS